MISGTAYHSPANYEMLRQKYLFDESGGKAMRILIVEDEPIMRKMYVELFDWEKNGFDLVDVAPNAIKALEVLHATKVDVVITDIKMPIMSGLELIRLAKEEFPKIKFIVMSGYDDFSLVREAFMLGVREYFLKAELDFDHISQTLLKLKEEIEKENKDSEDRTISSGESGNKEYNFLLCDKLMKELVWGRTPEKSAEQLKEYGVNLNHETLCIMVLSLVDYYTVEKSVWNNEREVFKYAMINVLDEICRKYGDLYTVYNLPNEYLILYSKEANVDFESIFNDITAAFLKCFSLVCNCGYSEMNGEKRNVEMIYQEAKKACDFCFAVGNGKMVAYQDIRFAGVEQNLSLYVQEMKNILKQGEGERIKDAIHKLRISANNVCHRQIDEVKNLFYLYYNEMVHFIKSQGIAKDDCETIFNFNNLKHKADLTAFNTWLTDSLSEISEALSNSGKVNKAKQYIRTHYSEQINLNTVAEHLGISVGHLSRIFRQSEGCGFSNYLLTTRMEAAKNLLTTTNLKIYEVAQQVGYTNTEQFSKMFKKVVGVTPKAFMK